MVFVVWLLLIPSLVLSGCGYRFGQGGCTAVGYDTISVPFVCGDEDGSLTAAVIKEIERSGTLKYVSSGGSLILKINLLDLRDENIGFRYDRNKEGKLTRSVIPTETRLKAIAEVCVVDACGGNTILGPVILSTSIDFDHDYYSSHNGINIFSLGQLTDYDDARDAVRNPLNKALGRKIVEYVNESW